MKKKVIAIITTLALAVSMAMPVVAATTPAAESADGAMRVKAVVGSSYNLYVSPSADLTADSLDATTYEGEFEVAIKGNIKATKKVVVANSGLTMEGEKTGVRVNCDVNMPVTEWMSAAYDTELTATQAKINSGNQVGTITGEFTEDDTYSGVITFTYSLENV